MFYIHGKYHNFILWKDFISFVVPEKQWKWWVYPLPLQNKSQNYPLKAGQTFSNNPLSIKVFRIPDLHIEQRKSKRLLVEKWLSPRLLFFAFQLLASIAKNSMVVSEYFNVRPIYRYYIGFTSSEIFIMLHLTSFTISLPPALKLLIPIKISLYCSFLHLIVEL